MTTLQSEDCQTNDLNDLFPMSIESLALPLDNSMRIVFTGYYNGFNIEVRSTEEMALLYHMGCFGKGSASRSKPSFRQHGDNVPQIMRRRQYMKRNYWYKKFSEPDEITESDKFLKELDELTAKIISDGEKLATEDVIDLVSSEEDDDEMQGTNNSVNTETTFHSNNKGDIVVIVPNSDSEDDDYFVNLKTKCCINKIKIREKLILSLEEAFFLTYGLGCLKVVNNNNILNIEDCWALFTTTDKRFIPKYVVYHYFRSKGYIVKPGIKFGGDYLLYKDGPGINHADYIVVVKHENIHNDWTSVLGHVRMANSTVKEVLIAEVTKSCESIKLPEELSSYSVREILLTRNIPVTINNDD
ncbi:tRNA-splicing endonuclease subunit SEN2 [Manduca sexta]|uniref:tRNA-splicing endonuclease subunit SEN2 n=1 Tax=Manduca sexta TaxID=7130 RepID=UPI001183B244|nr:tRNA-splicing endonuclease subunit SEN2 [Manduca sexta]